MKRRNFLTTTGAVGIALLAGCAGDGTETGEFRLLISDQPTVIDDFDSLNVTISSARIFRAGDDEEVTTGVINETSTETGNGEGFIEFEFDAETVDLTQVTGDRAVAVLEDELEAGQYTGIELHVDSAEGVVEGEDVDVKVPSNRLRIARPFEIAADEELSFVFDINVIRKGTMDEYNLLPVIGKSGVVGEDVEVEEVDA
jgi:hypothetical protein